MGRAGQSSAAHAVRGTGTCEIGPRVLVGGLKGENGDRGGGLGKVGKPSKRGGKQRHGRISRPRKTKRIESPIQKRELLRGI